MRVLVATKCLVQVRSSAYVLFCETKTLQGKWVYSRDSQPSDVVSGIVVTATIAVIATVGIARENEMIEYDS